MPVQAQMQEQTQRRSRKMRKPAARSGDSPAVRESAQPRPPFISGQLSDAIDRYMIERSPRPHRDLTDTFGRGVDDGTESYLDEVLMRPVRVALSSLDYPLVQSLFEGGLLTGALESALCMMQFLALCLPAARGAQAESTDYLPHRQCIPASILLAEAELAYGPACPLRSEKFEIEQNDVFRTGRKFDRLFDAFNERARQLAGDSRFAGVLRAVENSEDYLRQISVCEIWTELERLDIIDRITRHDLLECDSARRVL